MVATLNSSFFQRSSHARRRRRRRCRRRDISSVKCRGNENHRCARHVDRVVVDCQRGCNAGVSVWKQRRKRKREKASDEGARESQLLRQPAGLLRDLRDPGLPGSAGGSPGGNTRTIL